MNFKKKSTQAPIDRRALRKNSQKTKEEQDLEEEIEYHTDQSFDSCYAAIELFNSGEEYKPYLENAHSTIQNVTIFNVFAPESITKEVQEAIQKALEPFKGKPQIP